MSYLRSFALAVTLVSAGSLEALAQQPRFEEEITAFEVWDRKNATPENPILFVGSSSIRMWPTAEAFPGLPVVNRGFGGSYITESTHYADRIVLKYRPRAIVFYAGDNDINDGRTPEQVSADFRTFVDRVHLAFPETHVIFVAIKPSLARWQLWPVMRHANSLIAQYAAAHPQVDFADIAPVTLGPDGKPRPEFFLEDGLHLSNAGYAAWTTVVRKTLQEALRD